jgi:hypothetical protein
MPFRRISIGSTPAKDLLALRGAVHDRRPPRSSRQVALTQAKLAGAHRLLQLPGVELGAKVPRGRCASG